jgi:hypothetical protein
LEELTRFRLELSSLELSPGKLRAITRLTQVERLIIAGGAARGMISTKEWQELREVQALKFGRSRLKHLEILPQQSGRIFNNFLDTSAVTLLLNAFPNVQDIELRVGPPPDLTSTSLRSLKLAITPAGHEGLFPSMVQVHDIFSNPVTLRCKALRTLSLRGISKPVFVPSLPCHLRHLDVTGSCELGEDDLERIAQLTTWERLSLTCDPGVRVNPDWFIKLGRSSGHSLKVFKIYLDERLAMPQAGDGSESERESRKTWIERMSMLDDTLLLEFMRLCPLLHTLGLSWFSYITNAGTSPSPLAILLDLGSRLTIGSGLMEALQSTRPGQLRCLEVRSCPQITAEFAQDMKRRFPSCELNSVWTPAVGLFKRHGAGKEAAD